MQDIIKVENLTTFFDEKIIHNKISFNVKKNEIFGILGPSGCGKTTLLRELCLLEKNFNGDVNVLGYDFNRLSQKDEQKLKESWGVLFQFGALFSSLNVYENIQKPLLEYTKLDKKLIDDIIRFKIDIVGLKQSDAYLYPSELSGGMKKKAALARALALDAKLLFLDEPTSGLDPISAREFDALILKLRDLLDLSIVMVSHDLRSIYDTIDRFIVLDDKKIVYDGDIKGVKEVKNSFINTFFSLGDSV